MWRRYGSVPGVRWEDLDDMRRELDRLTRSLRGSSGASRASSGLFPPLNVTETGEAFFVRAELPGMSREGISLATVNNQLSIGGHRSIPDEGEGVSYHRRERASGSFDRTITLPTAIDAERISARYTNGVLTIEVPKAAAARPRTIEIGS